ncbi:MAG: transglycosylase SLT domain-containing protein [Nitrospirota bacterium]
MTDKNYRGLLLFALLVAIMALIDPLCAATESPKGGTAPASAAEPDHPLAAGKRSLDKGEYEKAIALLGAAYEKAPALGDYALLWRSSAYEKSEDTGRALADLKTIRERYKESPLLKQVRIREIELSRKRKDASTAKLFESFIKDHPSNTEVKFAYATFLKENNELQKAKPLFKEIYITVCPLSSRALAELSPADLTVEDMVKRGKALNTAWLFEESERIFREALRKDTQQFRSDILEGLALSLFRQKRYKEAAELYKQISSDYWRARSLYRAGEIDTLQAELPALTRTGDKRLATVLLAYGTKKRREGKIEEALALFNSVLAQYPAAKEETLWAIGWTHYLSRDYESALKILSQLAATYGDAKYAYWRDKSRELLAGPAPEQTPEPVKVSLARQESPRHTFYSFLSLVRGKQRLPGIKAADRPDTGNAALNPSLPPAHAERIDLLAKLGFRQEAVAELLHAAKKNPAPGDLIAVSASLKELGNYKMSMSTIAKVPYREDLHAFFYPVAYWPEVEEAARARGIDPYLVLSVMREESRFAPDARSIAGALGLMQLMPQTARQLNRNAGVRLSQSSDLYDPTVNIQLGAYYLSHLVNKMGSIPLALAAYNGGEDAVNDWLGKGTYKTIDEFIEDIPYDETRDYVKKVMTTYFEYLRRSADGDLSASRNRLGNL